MKSSVCLVAVLVLIASFTLCSDGLDADPEDAAGTAVYYSDVGLITITFNGVLPGPAEYGARLYMGHYEISTPNEAYWSKDLVSLGNTHTLNLADRHTSMLRGLPAGTYSIEIFSAQETVDPAWIYFDITDITSLRLTDSEIYLVPGQTYQLITQITPASAALTPLRWAATDDSVASVSDSGLVMANVIGDMVVTVSTYDGMHSATCLVHVTDSPVTPSISLSTYNITIPVGSTYTVSATVSPQSTTSVVSWSTASQSIATVSNGGTVTGIAVGQTDVTATYMGVKAVCHVTVTQSGGSTSIILNPQTLSIGIGESGRIYATVTPSSQSQNIIWTSSNPSVAVVSSDGSVVGVGAGTAVITARTVDGTTASTVVTISGSGGGSGGGSGCCGGGYTWFFDILALIVITLIILIILTFVVVIVLLLRSRGKDEMYWDGYEWRRLR